MDPPPPIDPRVTPPPHNTLPSSMHSTFDISKYTVLDLNPHREQGQSFTALSTCQLGSMFELESISSSTPTQESVSHLQEKLVSFPHNIQHLARPELVNQNTFTRYLVNTADDECQHASEYVNPANLSPLKDFQGKGKGVDRSQHYFGSKSKMSETSVRDEPHMPVKGEGWNNGREGPVWGDPKLDVQSGTDEGDSNDGEHGPSHQSTPSSHPAVPAAWGDNGNENQGDHTTSQGFQVLDGATEHDSGHWGSNENGWGKNAKAQKTRTRRSEAPVSWGNNNNGEWDSTESDDQVFNDNYNNTQGWGNASQVDNQSKQRYDWNCTQHDHSFEQPTGHVRSRHHSDATVRPLPRPSPPQPAQHQPNTQTFHNPQYNNYNNCQHHPQNHFSGNEAGQKQLIKELRDQNAAQAETITEQRVQIAVLENELKHANESKEAATNASVIIAQTLGAALGIQTKSPRRVIQERDEGGEREVAEMQRNLEAREKELETLRAKKLEGRGHGIQESASDEDTIHPLTPTRRQYNAELQDSTSEENVLQKLTPSRHRVASRRCTQDTTYELNVDIPRSNRAIISKGKGRKKVVSQTPVIFGGELHASMSAAPEKKRVLGEGLRKAYEKDKALAAQQARAVESSSRHTRTVEISTDSQTSNKVISGWEESFKSSTDIPTVPNSPVLDLSSSAFVPNYFPTYNLQNENNNVMGDIGIQSLDDFLDGGMFDDADATVQPGDALLADLDKEIELSPQLRAQIRAMQEQAALPAPTVLKTGTGLENSFRGAEYDHLIPQPAAHLGGMNNYRRFDTASTSNPYSSTNAGGLWSSEEERERVVKAHQRDIGHDGIRYPDMFRYGIQYTPEEDDENYIRAVSISNLPSHTTLREVLLRVRGGIVANAVLMDTRKVMDGKMSALITFAEDYDAHSFVTYVTQHPIIFSDEDEIHTAKVTLIPTPTYPPSQGMKKRMTVGRNNTRCIAIMNFPEQLSLSRLQHDISRQNIRRAEGLLEIYLDEHNNLHFEFSNMSLAGSAFGILTNWRAFRGLNVIYERDPCAGSLEKLAPPLLPHPPMLSRNRSPSTDNNTNSSSEHHQFRHVHFAQFDLDDSRQRKRLLALTQQKVEIPSFSGSGIKSGSWADEVIDEVESSDPSSSSSVSDPTNPSYSTSHTHQSHYAEHEEYNELPHAHSLAPPNSPIEGILPTHLSPDDYDVKETIDMTMTVDVNRLIKEAPSSFRKAPPGLAASKYATIVPSFEDRHHVPRHRSKRYSPQRYLTVNNGITPHAWKMGYTLTVDKGREVEELEMKDHHPELEPGNILAAALDSSSNEESKLDIEVASPETPYGHVNIPYPSPECEVVLPRAEYALHEPTYTSLHSENDSPTSKSQHPEQHTTPLAGFNAKLETEDRPSDNFSILPSPHTPANASATPPRQTPQKPHQNADTTHRSYHVASADVPEGEWTKEDVETFNNSSLNSKERYVKLIESGRGVGEFGAVEELVAELQSDSGGDREACVKGKGKIVEKKINSDEIDLDMDDDC